MKSLLTNIKTWLTIAVLGATVYAGGVLEGEPQGKPLSGAIQNPTHFAHIDGSTGVVKTIIVADQAFINSGAVGNPSEWVPTVMEYDVVSGAVPARIGGVYDIETANMTVDFMDENSLFTEQATSTEI